LTLLALSALLGRLLLLPGKGPGLRALPLLLLLLRCCCFLLGLLRLRSLQAAATATAMDSKQQQQ
jgi:hypothetical protein